MPEPRTAREIAETIILSHTEDIEWGSINEMTEDEFDILGEEAHEALCHEVADLIGTAVVTVTWPGESDQTAEGIAKAFHEAYERLAPNHGYETREASARPWADVPADNRALMIATVRDLIGNGIIADVTHA